MDELTQLQHNEQEARQHLDNKRAAYFTKDASTQAYTEYLDALSLWTRAQHALASYYRQHRVAYA